MKSWNSKKVAVIVILLLISCDVTLLFAAQQVNSNNNVAIQTSAIQSQGQLQQAQQLQQQTDLNVLDKRVEQPNSIEQQISQNVDKRVNEVSSQQEAILSAPQTQTTSAMSSLPQSYRGQPASSNSNDVPQTVSEQELNNAAFKAVTQNALPMAPEQIQRLRQLFNQTQYAATAMPGIPPRPATTSELVNLTPGSTPPIVRLQQGFVTSLVFVDSTGSPWPIEAYDIGNPSAFNIQWNKTDNIFMIQATTLYTYGNLAVKLQGLATPVMITLLSGQKAVDYRRELRISGYGPNAKPIAAGSNLPNSASTVLLGVLDGVPPAGSTALKVLGGGCDVWLSGDRMYVRTHYTVLSPAWLATMTSADGTKAYEMPKAPLLLVSQNGKIVQLKIEGL